MRLRQPTHPGGIDTLLLHIRAHLRPRLMEWMHSIMLVLWGSILLRPDDTFGSSPAFVGLARIASEDVWAWTVIGVGLLRVTALLINGLWRPSYTVRAVTSFLSLFIWFTISLGLLASPHATTGLAIYPVLCLFECVNLYYSTLDGAFARKDR